MRYEHTNRQRQTTTDRRHIVSHRTKDSTLTVGQKLRVNRKSGQTIILSEN